VGVSDNTKQARAVTREKGEEAGREDELRNDNERLGSEGRELSELTEPVAESGRVDAMGGLMTTTMMDSRRVIGNV
jgi:hypothetical protein